MHIALSFVILLLLGSAAHSAPNNALTRTNWVYSGSQGQGTFEYEGDGRWVETLPTGQRVSFMETARTANFVELHDAGRRLWVRLHAGHAEWRQAPKTQWNRLVAGGWVAPDKVPAISDYRIRLAYFVPRDRVPTAEYQKKIAVLMEFVRKLYRQSLQERGLAAKDLTFQMRGGEPLVHLIRGAHPASYYNGAPKYDAHGQYGRILAEIPQSVGVPAKHVMIVFAESYDENPPAKVEWAGGIALGTRYSNAGGVGIFSAWILRDEFSATDAKAQQKLLFDTTPIKGRTALGHGGPDSPRFEFIEDGFGAVAHELGHALGLPHDCRRNDLDIMCNGFRNIRWNFAEPPLPEKGGMFTEDNVRLLLSSRYISTELDFSDNTPPKAALRVASTALDQTRATVTVAVEASDDRALRAIAFLTSGNVVGGRWLKGTAQSFTEQLIVERPASGKIQIEALITDGGGNVANASVTTTAAK